MALTTTLLPISLRKLLALCAVMLAVLAVLAFLLIRPLFQPIPALEAGTSDEIALYEVTPGSSVTRVANDLHARGLLSHPLLFRLLTHWQGVSGSLQSGEYRLQPGMSVADVLADMVAGRNVQYRFTLVEGWTVAQALAAIRSAEKLTHTLPDSTDSQTLARALGLAYESAEGMIFPDTYFYTKGTTDIELLRRASARLQEVLQNAWAQRLGALPFDSPYEALILASIIEKESAIGSERDEIAGVFVRRLEQGMRLQSDPTVIYGLGESFDGNIRREDLRAETAYNTYRINGLPPTPIALAGEESIRASLNPAQSDALYFVSRGDGSHYFSSTLEEHNAAVNRFQRQGSATEIENTRSKESINQRL